MVKIISHTPRAQLPKTAPISSIKPQVSKEAIQLSPRNHPYNFVLTCQSGLESLVKRECERIGLQDIHAQDRLVKCGGSEKNMYELLIWSRFANRVYLSLSESRIIDFDTLHDTLSSIEWSEYLTGKERIVIEASSTKSTLASVPTIQSVGQNAIFSTLVTPNYTNDTEVHILILIIDDIAHILLDVTGDPLHKRGYRREAGEAPLKENLAAALLAFSGWKYKQPLMDPFCGSGTIAIEAAMMARGIAPGLFRGFRIEELPCFSESLLENVRAEAEKKIYPSGSYTIIASDIEPEMIRISEENARRA
jgi:putative N6-adenine-specific DNA methylase